MKDFAQRLADLIIPLIGAAVFLAIIYWAAEVRSSRWRAVEARYGGTGRGEPLGRLLLETLAFADRGSLGATYGGRFDSRYMSVRVTLYADGLQFDAVPPFNILRRPFFLPFADMAPLRSDGHSGAPVFALRMKRLADTDLLVRKQVVAFVRARTDVPPFGLGA